MSRLRVHGVRDRLRKLASARRAGTAVVAIALAGGSLLAGADRTNLCHLPSGPHCIRCGISAGQNSDEHVRAGVGYHAPSHPPV